MTGLLLLAALKTLTVLGAEGSFSEEISRPEAEVLEPELTELLDNLNVTLYRTCEGPVSVVWEGEGFSVRQDPI